MPAYYKTSSNFQTKDLVYNIDETDTIIASVPFESSNGYFGLLMHNSNYSKNATFQYNISGNNVVIAYTNNPDNLVSIPGINISNQTLSISTHINTSKCNSSVSLKSSGSNYGEGVIVTKYDNKLIATVPNEEQLIITPTELFVNGTYLNRFTVTDNNKVDWTITAKKVTKSYDMLTVSDFTNISMCNGSSNINVTTDLFMTNFAPFVSDSNGVLFKDFKRGPNPEVILNSIIYTYPDI